jgi:predicted pyridoxine 5'-phosphate oxidase superfamily flavin-nucleotide-binding protein
MANLNNDMKELLDTALADGTPCVVATVDGEGRPNMTPKGSVMVFDEQHLAYWERARKNALDNVRVNPHVAVYYRNPDQADRLPGGNIWRFYGDAQVHEDDEIREQVMARTIQAELDRDPERLGVAVLIRVDKVLDIRGNEC